MAPTGTEPTTTATQATGALKGEPTLSFWRYRLQLIVAARTSWRLHLEHCPQSWKCIRSGVSWCCLLLFVNAAYWLFGGLLFASLEGWHESRYKCGALRIRRHFIDELWEQSAILPEDEWRTLARQRLVDFEDQLHEAFSAGLTSYSGKRTWGFWDAVAFSMTTVATIGYGHIVPVTWLGRLTTIGYSLFGIPLFLVLLAESGLLLTRMIKFFWVYYIRFSATPAGKRFVSSGIIQASFKMFHRKFNTLLEKGRSRRFVGPFLHNIRTIYNEGIDSLKTSGDFVIDDRFDISAVWAIVLLYTYLIFGSLLFFISEEWSPLESFYFVFISLTTIGFGDYVPQHPLAILTSAVYIIFGLALTGLCLNAIQAEFLQRSEEARVRLSSMLALQLSGSEVVQLGPSVAISQPTDLPVPTELEANTLKKDQ